MMYTESFDSTQPHKKDLASKIVHHPLFLHLAGPFVLLLNLCALIAYFSIPSLLFSFAAALGYGFSWKYQIKGAIYSFGLLGFSCAFLFFIDSLPLSLTMTTLIFISFSSAYFLIGITSDSLTSLKEQEGKSLEEKIVALQTSYETNLKYLQTQLEDQLEHGKSLDKALKIQDKELLSLRQLIKMSHLEAEKYKQEVVEYQTRVETYHQSLVSYEQQEEHLSLVEQRAKQLVKHLNQERVEAFQQKLLLEECQKQVKSFEKPSCFGHVNSCEELTSLQQERARTKQCYHEQLRIYQSCAGYLESLLEQKDQGSKEAFVDLENQAKLLQDLRLDILKIEESILHLKKELKLSSEEGLSPGSYLAVADQECTRLEEENALLLKLLAHSCMKAETKEELVNLDAEKV